MSAGHVSEPLLQSLALLATKVQNPAMSGRYKRALLFVAPSAMSISALASSLQYSTATSSVNPYRQVQQDFQSLGTALQSGNLASAQSAMSTLQQAQQSSPAPPSSIVSLQSATSSVGQAVSGTVASEMSTLGTDLQSGNLSAAQSVYQQIQSQMQSAQASGHRSGHGGGHGSGGGIGALLSATSSSSGSSTSGSSLNTLLNALTATSTSSTSAATSGSASLMQTAFTQLIQGLQSMESATGGLSGAGLNISA